MRGNSDGEALGGDADLVGKFPVGLVIHQEHGGLCDFGRPPVEFNAVKLVDGKFLLPGHVKSHPCLTLAAANIHNERCL